MSLTKSEIKNKMVKNIIHEINNIFSNNKNIIKNHNIQQYLIHLEKELLNILDNIIEKELKSFIGNDNTLMIEHIINNQIDTIVNNSIKWYNNYESETVNKRIDKNIDLYSDKIKDILIQTIKKVCITENKDNEDNEKKEDNEDNEKKEDNEDNEKKEDNEDNEKKEDIEDNYFLKNIENNINIIELTANNQIKNEFHSCNCVCYIFYCIYDSILDICFRGNSTIEKNDNENDNEIENEIENENKL